jgi:hypothetical protein
MMATLRIVGLRGVESVDMVEAVDGEAEGAIAEDMANLGV